LPRVEGRGGDVKSKKGKKVDGQEKNYSWLWLNRGFAVVAETPTKGTRKSGKRRVKNQSKKTWPKDGGRVWRKGLGSGTSEDHHQKRNRWGEKKNLLWSTACER